ncbi:unnamed protein product [Pseudo-nitzschia multistriata]|uniref:OCRE domain-containing protein n=1 Tax=Pseudo-nitzschia multistriata TaxID=183589 RepID=A0A448ZSJ5_9STRA|nr:unnamed protein product [Pseudo-nitzschia multistriata]
MRSLAETMKLLLLGVIVCADVADRVAAFAPTSKSSACATNSLSSSSSLPRRRRVTDVNRNPIGVMPTVTTSSTSLSVLLDVPDHFFLFYFPMLGILLDLSKKFARFRLEESAWEQRLEEAREKRLREDPTLTELELRRKEASLEWSAYGKPRRQEEEQERAMREEKERGYSRVKVREREYDDDDEYSSNRTYQMSDEEINQFELEYGLEYDPYYDDPYSEDELPDDINFNVDKKYGDRIYDNGEIFYKEKESGLFYRQGAKPRNLSFW